MITIRGIIDKVASRKLGVTAVAGAAAATGAVEITWPIAAIAMANIAGRTVVDTWVEYGKRGTQYRKLWVHIPIGLSFSLRLTYRRYLILHRSPSKRREKRRPIGSGSRRQHHGCPVPHHHFVHVSNDYARDCEKINQAEGAIKQAMWQKTFPNQPLFRRCARLPSPITRL